MEIQKMNPEVKAKWLTALRSGLYPQGKNELKGDSGYCCLGVLCDVHQQDVHESGNWSREGAYLGKGFDLPLTVSAWAGLTTQRDIKLPLEVIPEAYHNSLAWRFGLDWVWISQLNDAGMPFAEIADLIEAHL